MKKIKDKWLSLGIVSILVLLIINGISIYRETFINWLDILTILTIVILITIPLSLKIFKRKETVIGIVLLNIIIVLPLTYYSFLKINTYTKHEKIENQTFKILKKSEFYRRLKTNREQTIEIDFNGIKKLLVFAPEEKEIIQISNSITIYYYKGILGYNYLKNYNFK